ncbi:MAG: exo-alpha-sialidase [Treponema sp.]|nr:exo-alpha-sialidase [Treponema sp.]
MPRLSLDWMEEAGFDESVPPSRHASTLLPLAGGGLLAACFAGSAEGASDVGIWLARRERRGSWAAPARVDAEPGEAHWNPVLALRADGSIVLFYKVGDRIASWRTLLTESRDDGVSWSRPAELVPGDRGGRGPVRTKILRLDKGVWLAGASLEQGPRWTSFIDRSTDEGRTWKRSADLGIEVGSVEGEPVDGGPGGGERTGISRIPVSEQSFRGRGLIQPTLWKDGSGLHCLMRSTEGAAYASDSVDEGLSWTAPIRTSIPNNNSGLDILSLDRGNLILAHNPIAENWGVRTPLVLSLSPGRGSNFEVGLVLDSGPGEFSYPALVEDKGGILVSWTRDRRAIAVARVAIGGIHAT